MHVNRWKSRFLPFLHALLHVDKALYEPVGEPDSKLVLPELFGIMEKRMTLFQSEIVVNEHIKWYNNASD